MSDNDDYEARLTMLLQDAIEEAGPVRAETLRALWRVSALLFTMTAETSDRTALENMGAEIGKMFVRMVSGFLADEARESEHH
jgi:hypothetical protein